MDLALGLAARGLGQVWPNPAVGCVLVRDGRVVGRGWTQPGGRPHAETEALARAGDAARGATAYVTLEPCAHHGRTGPCAEALARAGVARVVHALRDPDPRVDGGGAALLRAAGIAVEEGVGEAAARRLNAGFLSRLGRGRPLITLKLATSLDGRIAAAGGESRWITGPAARAHGHALRASHDAILVGAGTARADDPSLDCRLPGMAARSPLRIVIAGAGPLDGAAKLRATAAERPTWLIVAAGAEGRFADWAGAGADLLPVAAGADGRPDAGAALAALGLRGLTRLLVEGGAGLAASLLRAGLVDRLACYRAPMLIGGDGLAASEALGIGRPGEAPRWRRTGLRALGDDLLETFDAAD
ncbi:bifunctional diaminohydroxyphosphoribosylaminopyrimidine deaminase/5-amino-6-(5-phosphoribosylamino)uracil reductase RibD [Oceanibacterium hippocampi]|uniref:Riboflavin biosynthesis protein RibD n=1 Tax=Oceanibacterium hippocampi TaxID=745714 RepID=A0A1Y5SRI4_9PROT|nr:bifunctional diaminohydroxyphosphoribosylaminopyrimidine deaminase/5-amino-6-(5-phosphoribosylamino)uracil reductase RibD [Oceanibacterium hippocampi]SLN44893.1 Riboflavin biosynthesis protein RibD [Oceanibacterium hippocampi]